MMMISDDPQGRLPLDSCFFANDDDDDYLKTGGQTRGDDMTTGYDNRMQFPVAELATVPCIPCSCVGWSNLQTRWSNKESGVQF